MILTVIQCTLVGDRSTPVADENPAEEGDQELDPAEGDAYEECHRECTPTGPDACILALAYRAAAAKIGAEDSAGFVQGPRR